jgi:hypothetical protein
VWQQMTQIKTQTLRPQIHDSSSFLFVDIRFLKLFFNQKASENCLNRKNSKKILNFTSLLDIFLSNERL